MAIVGSSRGWRGVMSEVPLYESWICMMLKGHFEQFTLQGWWVGAV